MITNKRVREDTAVGETACKRTCVDVADSSRAEPLYRLPCALRTHEDNLMDQYDFHCDNFVERLDVRYNSVNIKELSMVDDSGRCLECYKGFIGEDKLAYTDHNVTNECKRLKLTKVEAAFLMAVLGMLYSNTNEVPQSDLEQMVDEDDDNEFSSNGVYLHHVEVIMDMMLYYQCVKWAKDAVKLDLEDEDKDSDGE